MMSSERVRVRRLTWVTAVAPLAMVLSPVAASGATSLDQGAMAHHSYLSRTISTSTNWSGYDVTGGPYTSVSANWTEPAVSCGSGATYSSFWVGLDGDTSSSVEQTGTDSDCSGGRGVYYGWYEMYPAYPVNFSNPVTPGDAMSASVTTDGAGNFTLVLQDGTKWTQTVHASLSSAKLASAEVIAEAPSSGSVLPLANFGTVNFSGATLSSPNEIVMVTKSGAVEAQPSTYSGGAFTVTWKSSGGKHGR